MIRSALVGSVWLHQLVGKGLEPLADDDVERLALDRGDDEAPAKADDSFDTPMSRLTENYVKTPRRWNEGIDVIDAELGDSRETAWFYTLPPAV